MGKIKIKKGDQVKVLAGKDKGKTGEVLVINTSNYKAIVAGLNVVKKHTKPNAQNPQGGIQEMEAPIHISNLSLMDANGKTTRVSMKVEGDKKVRIAKTTGKAV